MKIIPYETSHFDTLVQLLALLQDYEKTLSDDRACGVDVAINYVNYILKECKENDGEIYVAVDGLTVFGFVCVYIEKENDGDSHLLEQYKTYGVISDLAVFDEFRNQGVAVALLAKAEQHCKLRNLNRIKISFLADNRAAKSLYRKFGLESYEVTYDKHI